MLQWQTPFIGLLFGADMLAVSNPAAARIPVSQVEPHGAVFPQHPPYLAEDCDEVLDVEIDGRFKAQATSPRPTFGAGASMGHCIGNSSSLCPVSPGCR